MGRIMQPYLLVFVPCVVFLSLPHGGDASCRCPDVVGVVLSQDGDEDSKDEDSKDEDTKDEDSKDEDSKDGRGDEEEDEV